MIWVFAAVMLIAVGVPIYAESKAHPYDNTLIGLRKALGAVVGWAVLLILLAIGLPYLVTLIWHFFFS